MKPYLSTLLLLVFIAMPALGQDTAEKKPDKWDIAADHGPAHDVSFTTTEGTWMSLDVSPDGKTIVFDLMGELYTMPTAGGKATPLLVGPAYEVQPRFSPDGTRIAFTSDRAGGDNLWTMKADGTDLKQVTKEDFRLVNGPAWTPDGQYLLGRKHFTSERSLGAGEVWMYHISGGSGLKLTSRKNDQQDQGNEISVSPDGRYVYFSEDMSGGSTFQYNKDPNTQIYTIRRLDRETGDIRDLISGFGGSIRPVPSPDGKSIAFVRRIKAKSVLHIYDIESGRETPIYNGLTHDQQEAWAIFGVYPNFAWTPDSKDILFSAGGGFHRINVASYKVQAIPFEADVNIRVTEAVRFAQDVSPETFEAKMIRFPATSPDGKTLVFQAIGHLWTKALPNGAPKRLTNDTHFEYEPAFSPDGKTIVYTTWDDENLSSIYSVASTGGTAKKLNSKKGYYSSPRFSPDGSKIIYQRTSGHPLLGTDYGTERGLYWISSHGGAGTKIRENGREPRIGPDERVYFLMGGRLSKTYRSVRLDGGDERTHFNLKYATTVVPSPDFEWVAFNELHNAYIAPFPKTGGAIDLTKDTKAVPVKQITRDAGLYLHWSSDGQQLHWLLGPEYLTRSLKNSFNFVAGAPEKLPAIDSTGVRIGLTVKTDAPTGVVAFTDARVITMNGDKVLENATLVVENNRITQLGSASSVTVPTGAKRIDAAGKTIMPGIVDVHGHMAHFYSGASPQQNWPYYANLAYGVTTSHDPSANTPFVFSQSELVKAGLTVGPRVYSTGTILYGADGDIKAVINSLDDARSHLRRMKAVGAFSVKSYNQPRREQRQQVLQAARELEMMVVPEGGSTLYHNMTEVIDGHTGIEHNVPVSPLYNDVMTVWGATKVGYTPTLVVSYGSPNGELYWYQHTNVWDQKRLLTFHPPSDIDQRSRRPEQILDEEYFHFDQSRDLKSLVDRGGKVQLGAHGQRQGLGAHWELWMFAQGGMTNMEALRSATLSGAEYLGLDGDIGSLKPGMLADLIVLNSNPLDDIRNSEDIEYVMVNGRLYDAHTMNEIGNHPKTRKPFYWQK